MSNVLGARRALVARILEGEGDASQMLRQAAFDNAGLSEPLHTFVGKIVNRANTVTAEDIAATRASALSEDEVFEIVICAAVGQATRQHDAALAALRAAIAEE